MVPDTTSALGREPSDNVIVYGKKTVRYSVVHCRRKTLEIAVLPDGLVCVRAPLKSTPEAIAAKVRKRATWVLRR